MGKTKLPMIFFGAFMLIFLLQIAQNFYAMRIDNHSTELKIEREVYSEDSSIIEAVEKVKDIVATVTDLEGEVLGTAFLLDLDTAVTAAHLFSDQDMTYLIETIGPTLKANIAKQDKSHDLLILDLSSDERKSLLFNEVQFAENLKLGQKVFAIGYNFEMPGSVVTGIVSGLDRDLLGYEGLIQLDMNLTSGMSGAPLFNLNGEIVAMIVAVSKDQSGVGLAVLISEIGDFIN